MLTRCTETYGALQPLSPIGVLRSTKWLRIFQLEKLTFQTALEAMPEENASPSTSNPDMITTSVTVLSKAISETTQTVASLTQSFDAERLTTSSVEIIAKAAESLSKIFANLADTVGTLSAELASGSGTASENVSKAISALAESLNKSTASLSEVAGKLGESASKVTESLSKALSDGSAAKPNS